MKGARARNEILKFLTDQEKSTQEIKDHLNQKYRHGVSMWQLVNILGKTNEIVKVGDESVEGFQGTSSRHCIWTRA